MDTKETGLHIHFAFLWKLVKSFVFFYENKTLEAELIC